MYAGFSRLTATFLSVLMLLGIASPAQAAEPVADRYTPTVLITGANRGLGLEFVRQYGARGWKVIATARDPVAAKELQVLAADHDNITVEQLDVTDFAQIDALAAKYKDQPVDVLLNNAGLSGSPSPQQLFQRLDYELFDAFMHTNALGPLKICETFLPHVQAGQLKRMVTVTSLGGSFSAPESNLRGTMLYRSSKAALNMLMVNVAAAVKKYDITVVLLNPGLVDTQGVLTEMNEKMKMGLDLVPIEQSIAGMINVIETAPFEQSGAIYQWNGEPLGY
jgi:NAD(P)-dependent dehydrogenase (short-subunit alcohol dehydrogenase family)